METGHSTLDFHRLRWLMRMALALGLVVLAGSAWLLGVFHNPEVATGVMAFAFGAIAFSAFFYFGALLTEGSLQKFIVSDDTEIKGDAVDLVTTTQSSGDPRTDGWVKAYVFARNLFGMSVIPLLILLGLYLFG
jgi:hypothetical protein